MRTLLVSIQKIQTKAACAVTDHGDSRVIREINVYTPIHHRSPSFV